MVRMNSITLTASSSIGITTITVTYTLLSHHDVITTDSMTQTGASTPRTPMCSDTVSYKTQNS